MKHILNELIDHRSLTKETARQVLVDLTSGKYNHSQTTAFMTVYMMRSITVDELQGFRDAMLELCLPAKFDQPVMDVCGTGGDGKNTFNISTLSSFVVAAAGQPVAKHGNYGVSSACGSSNLLEHFGYKNVAPIRKELGVKTFFNMLGPMVNPAFPKRQLVGVFSLELARQYGYLYQNTDKDFVILHSIDGYDEVSLTCPVKYFSNKGERLATPGDLGMPQLKYGDLRGGDTVEESAQVFMRVLEGKGTSAQNSAVIANAGMALFAGHQDEGIPAAMIKAKESLESGKALKAFKNLLQK